MYFQLPLPDPGELDLMRQVGKLNLTFSGFVQEFLIDMYGYVRIGGVEMLDWNENGMAMLLVAIHMTIFIVSFFYFLYNLVSIIQEQLLPLQSFLHKKYFQIGRS
jgi:hypothetical protein